MLVCASVGLWVVLVSFATCLFVHSMPLLTVACLSVGPPTTSLLPRSSPSLPTVCPCPSVCACVRVSLPFLSFPGQLSVVEGKLAEMKAEVGVHGAPTEYKKGKLLACTSRRFLLWLAPCVAWVACCAQCRAVLLSCGVIGGCASCRLLRQSLSHLLPSPHRSLYGLPLFRSLL